MFVANCGHNTDRLVEGQSAVRLTTPQGAKQEAKQGAKQGAKPGPGGGGEDGPWTQSSRYAPAACTSHVLPSANVLGLREHGKINVCGEISRNSWQSYFRLIIVDIMIIRQ